MTSNLAGADLTVAAVDSGAVAAVLAAAVTAVAVAAAEAVAAMAAAVVAVTTISRNVGNNNYIIFVGSRFERIGFFYSF